MHVPSVENEIQQGPLRNVWTVSNDSCSTCRCYWVHSLLSESAPNVLYCLHPSWVFAMNTVFLNLRWSTSLLWSVQSKSFPEESQRNVVTRSTENEKGSGLKCSWLECSVTVKAVTVTKPLSEVSLSFLVHCYHMFYHYSIFLPVFFPFLLFLTLTLAVSTELEMCIQSSVLWSLWANGLHFKQDAFCRCGIRGPPPHKPFP